MLWLLSSLEQLKRQEKVVIITHIGNTRSINSDVNLIDGGISLVLTGSSLYFSWSQYTPALPSDQALLATLQRMVSLPQLKSVIQQLFTKFDFHNTLKQTLTCVFI